jgi:hypothetical protein
MREGRLLARCLRRISLLLVLVQRRQPRALERRSAYARPAAVTPSTVSGCVVERCLSEYYRNDLRIYRSALESGFTDEQWQDIMRDG